MALVRQSDDQVERFKTYVRSLNEQFARWIVQQWETKSDKFWSHGMVDYLRHAVIIKRDHPDAAAMLGVSPTPSWTQCVAYVSRSTVCIHLIPSAYIACIVSAAAKTSCTCRVKRQAGA